MIKACIFDLDGVIVDTAKYHYQSWKKLAQYLGFDLSEEQNEPLKGIARPECLDLILEIGQQSDLSDEKKQALANLTPEEKVKLTDLKNKWYVDLISHMKPNEILPGAKEFVRVVKDAGMQTALGSASKNAKTILKHIGMDKGYFDVVIDGTDNPKAKPDPDVFLKGAKALGIEPQYCVVYEDAQVGVQAANAGGIYSVGIGSEKNLYEADLVVSGLDEMTLKKLHSLKKKTENNEIKEEEYNDEELYRAPSMAHH